MKDLWITIGFIVFIACVICYLLWKENSERYFDGKYDAEDRKPAAPDSTKMVENKRKPGHDNKGVGGK